MGRADARNARQEQTRAAHIPVYTIDPYLHYPIEFDLDALKTGHIGPLGPRVSKRRDLARLSAKAARFEVIKTDSIDQIHGSYFWVGWTDSSWHEKLTPPEMLEQRGCEGGAGNFAVRQLPSRLARAGQL